MFEDEDERYEGGEIEIWAKQYVEELATGDLTTLSMQSDESQVGFYRRRRGRALIVVTRSTCRACTWCLAYCTEHVLTRIHAFVCLAKCVLFDFRAGYNPSSAVVARLFSRVVSKTKSFLRDRRILS